MTHAVLAIVIAVHLVLAVALSGVPVERLVSVASLVAGTLILFLVWYVGSVGARLAHRGSGRPLRTIGRLLERDRNRIVQGTGLLLAIAVALESYTSLKVQIPEFIPFYADPYFADLDLALFGQDPWVLTHVIMGVEVTRWIDWFYLYPCGLVTMGMTVWACFSTDKEFRKRSVLAFVLCWLLLGVWVAVGLSSAGPVYYEHFYGLDRFEPLVETLAPDLEAVRIQKALLLDNEGIKLGSGISAMPSMHNATYILLAVMVYSQHGLGWRFSTTVAFEFLVFVSSVHLGWHYAVDALLPIFLVPLVWWLAGRIVETERKQSIAMSRDPSALGA